MHSTSWWSITVCSKLTMKHDLSYLIFRLNVRSLNRRIGVGMQGEWMLFGCGLAIVVKLQGRKVFILPWCALICNILSLPLIPSAIWNLRQRVSDHLHLLSSVIISHYLAASIFLWSLRMFWCVKGGAWMSSHSWESYLGFYFLKSCCQCKIAKLPFAITTRILLQLISGTITIFVTRVFSW